MHRMKIQPESTIRLLLAATLASLCACAGNHAALNPAGPDARRIAGVWWLFFDVAVAVYVIVIAALVFALMRKRTAPADSTPRTESSGATRAEDGASRIIVGTAVGITVAVLIVLALSDFLAQHTLAKSPPDPLRIELTGYQWWWGVQYDDPDPAGRFHTANELHVPVGRTVQLIMSSQDVIHSFWLPNLQGKKDLIPGRVTEAVFTAERPGVYEGQCAEFCGYQHAKMRLIVHADPQDAFNAWKAKQHQPGQAPQTDDQHHGLEVFMQSSCSLCHTIQGTHAQATIGPDLTHLAGRGTLAAGSLPNTPENLSSWILDPQHIKPGVRMPGTAMSPQDLRALVAYLTSLQ
jgi:cytochrome c oxidase subunit 2